MTNQLGKHNHLTIRLPLAICMLFAMKAWSITPLDEKSLDGVSAETSHFVLDIYGATAAGLAVEREEDQLNQIVLDSGSTAHKEGEEAAPAAKQKLETLEKQASNSTEPQVEATILENDLVTEVIESSTQLVQQNESLDSSKQIRYQPNGHHHDKQVLGKDSVMIARDIHVELLEFQRLKHDEAGDGGFGNLYLSDWNSRGSATINIVE